MVNAETNEVVNRIYVIHARSLPHFLYYAQPWRPAQCTRAVEVLADIVSDQTDVATRAGRLIVEGGGVVASGRFPNQFSDLHDLSFAYMLSELIHYQERTIRTLEQCVEQLPPDSAAQELAQEALGKAKAHRDLLGDLQQEHDSTSHDGPS